MVHYPILFSRRDLVKTKHFTAGVIVAGRILVSGEDGEFWAEGVSPGGLADGGNSVQDALSAFCKSYHEVLLDIGEDEDDFANFKKAVERFFDDTNMTTLKEWEEAVSLVKTGEVTLEEIGRRPSESLIGIQVLKLDDQGTKKAEVSEVRLAA